MAAGKPPSGFGLGRTQSAPGPCCTGHEPTSASPMVTNGARKAAQNWFGGSSSREGPSGADQRVAAKVGARILPAATALWQGERWAWLVKPRPYRAAGKRHARATVAVPAAYLGSCHGVPSPTTTSAPSGQALRTPPAAAGRIRAEGRRVASDRPGSGQLGAPTMTARARPNTTQRSNGVLASTRSGRPSLWWRPGRCRRWPRRRRRTPRATAAPVASWLGEGCSRRP